MSNIRIDTGMIDSHNHLGINAKPTDRIKIRGIMECAPLKTDGYVFPQFHAVGGSRKVYLHYDYGLSLKYVNSSNFPITFKTPSYPFNETTNSTDTRVKSSPGIRPDYTLECVSDPDLLDLNLKESSVYPWSSSDNTSRFSQFSPIPELRRLDALVSLIFLSASQILFIEPVDDDWFAAHRSATASENNPGEADPFGHFTLYVSDQIISVLGCAEQWQYCKPDGANCTKFDDFIGVSTDAPNFFDTDMQKQTLFDWVTAYDGTGGDLFNFIGNMPIGALTAQNSLTGNVQGPLPSNQWQQEVLYWHSIRMAKMQKLMIERATGPSDTAMDPFMLRPEDLPGSYKSTAQRRCETQVSHLYLIFT